MPTSILYVRGSSATAGDLDVINHLETEGYDVTSWDGTADPSGQFASHDAIVISDSGASEPEVSDDYAADYLGFAGGLVACTQSGSSPTVWSALNLASGALAQSARNAWFVDDPDHPTANGVSGGAVGVLSNNRNMPFAADGDTPFGAGVAKVAHLEGNDDRWVLFAYDDDDALTSGNAAGRRVAGTFVTTRHSEWSSAMTAMFNASVAWVADSTGATLLPTPTNFAFVASPSSRQLDGSWDAVSGADYEWQVQRSDDGTWVSFESDTTASTSFQLTDTDGVGWGKTYRARVRAVPEV